MKSEAVPVEPVSVAEHVQDELEARGWTIVDAAPRIGGNIGENMLWLGLLLNRPTLLDAVLSEAKARQLEEIFSIPAEVWMKLDEAYQKAKGEA